MKTEGVLSRTIAIIMPGSDLSQPASPTDRVVAVAAHGQLDGVGDGSREASDERIPSWPIAMPSVR